jgi:hypothetical protein
MIKRIALVFSVVLLLLNGIGALYGGSMLIRDPSGGLLQMPLSFLQHSPFDSYLIPGIILLIFNGLLSVSALLLIAFKHRLYPLFIFFQGLVLCVWITTQIILLQIFYPPLHATFLTTGFVLMLSGLYLKKRSAV